MALTSVFRGAGRVRWDMASCVPRHRHFSPLRTRHSRVTEFLSLGRKPITTGRDSLLTALQALCLAEGSRRQRSETLEVLAEVKLVRIAHLTGDILDRIGALNQSALGLTNAIMPQPVDGRGTQRW